MTNQTLTDIRKLIDMCLELPTKPTAQDVGRLDGQARLVRIDINTDRTLRPVEACTEHEES